MVSQIRVAMHNNCNDSSGPKYGENVEKTVLPAPVFRDSTMKENKKKHFAAFKLFMSHTRNTFQNLSVVFKTGMNKYAKSTSVSLCLWVRWG